LELELANNYVGTSNSMVILCTESKGKQKNMR